MSLLGRIVAGFGRMILALVTLMLSVLLRRTRRRREQAERIVPESSPAPAAENVVVGLLGVATLLALGFIVVYAEWSAWKVSNELLGICLGLSLAFISAALTVVAKRLVVTEEIEHDYPPERHPEEEQQVTQLVRESGSGITRKRLLVGAGAAAGGALGVAVLTPALSLGPLWYTDPLYRTPWKRGIRLIDETGRPYAAAEIEQETFYTAFPEGASTEDIASPVVLVRLDPSQIQLPRERAQWAPGGILAYSKICTHAGCAIALYRKPTFPVLEPRPALVCPCHYSTFDPATGGTVIYGPAGRSLPQLPLMIDGSGNLRAGGNYSGPVGPSWWGVRSGKAT
ncbi:MAG TPA: Rieske 2Fe-2S domain-containing protein [Solirubrobacteraceae bacterium]|nr:Rieske 2Fe-2S domain-containing protein [Solirubrobacteraceae bacterium]